MVRGMREVKKLKAMEWALKNVEKFSMFWRNEKEEKASSAFLEEEALCRGNREDGNIEVESRRKKEDFI